MLKLRPVIQWVDDPRNMSRSDIISIFHCLSLEDPTSTYSTVLSFLVAGRCLLIPDDKCEYLTADCGEYKITFYSSRLEGRGLLLTVYKCEGRAIRCVKVKKKLSVTDWTPSSWFEEYNGYKVNDCTYKISLPDSEEEEEDDFVFLTECFLDRSFLVDKAGIRLEKESCNENYL